MPPSYLSMLMPWLPTIRLHPEDRALLRAILRNVLAVLGNTSEIIMKEIAVRKEIQDLVAVVGPLVTAVEALESEAAVQTETIADLKAKLDAGTALTPEEVQALADAGTALSGLTAEVVAKLPPVTPAVEAASTAASKAGPGV